MKIRLFKLLLLLIAAETTSVAQDPSIAKPPVFNKTSKDAANSAEAALQDQLEKLCKERNLPAIWAGNFQLGQEPIIAATGIRKWNTEDSAKAEDIVHIGSCTKAMTSAIIGQLCTEGKLTLQSTLGEVFHDIDEVRSSKWSEVTLMELMQHRSGAIANFDYHALDRLHPNDVVAARRELLVKLAKTKRARKPRFLYSNIGFIVLGHVAEHIEKKAWEEIIVERLFLPLKMSSAHFGPVGKPDRQGKVSDETILPNRAWGHTESLDLVAMFKSILGTKSQPQYVVHQIDNSRCLGPAGRVHLNLRDWAKFTMLYAQEDGYSSLGISKEVWQEILKPMPVSPGEDDYAAGWIVYDLPKFGGTCYYHNGSNTTWYAYALAMPNKQQCVLVATNAFTDSAMKTCDDIAKSLVHKEGDE